MFDSVKLWQVIVAFAVCVVISVFIFLFIPVNVENNNITATDAQTTDVQTTDTQISAYIDIATENSVPKEEWIYFYDTFRDCVYRCYVRSDGNVQMLLDSNGNPSIAGFIEPLETKENTTTE